MSFVIEYRDRAANHLRRSNPIADRQAALQQACTIESTRHGCEVPRIVGDDGTEISRAEIDSYMVEEYGR
jgi:hypothetical protein